MTESAQVIINRNVHYVTYRQGHHSLHSGYDRITQYTDRIIEAESLPRGLIRDRIMWRIADGVIAYDRKALATELKTAGCMLKNRGGIYHILYGENTYHYLGFLNNLRRNRLVATFHLPPDPFRQVVRTDWHIRQLSAVVCVGQTQLEFFADFLGQERVFFVPHGVDTEYFSPPASFAERSSNLCLFVGSYLRDFPTLRGVIELVTFQRPEIQFIVVTSPGNFERIGFHPNLTLRTGITESELLSLYRLAAVMVMPMQDATANNAVLEGMACGLPVVVTDVGSIRDYLNPACAVMVLAHDSRTMAQEVLDVLDDAVRRQAMSEQARQEALKFSWPEVIRKLQSVYEAIA
jgi:glycosyltransferase involved in cell wall biosynthesis